MRTTSTYFTEFVLNELQIRMNRFLVTQLLAFLNIFFLKTASGIRNVEDDGFVLKANSFPDDVRLRPPIGNGHIATNVLSDTIYMNGVFNGYADDSHRARIPSTVAIDVVKEDTRENRTYILNMKDGMFIQTISRSQANIELRYFAHRHMTRLLICEISLERTGGFLGDVIVRLLQNRGNTSADIAFLDEEILENNTRYAYGEINEPETNTSAKVPIHHYSSDVPNTLTLTSGDKNKKWYFMTSLSIDKLDALTSYQNGMQSVKTLTTSHQQAWNTLWESGSIHVEGNRETEQTINACLYHIWSSMPSHRDHVNPFIGLSPGGLSRGGKIRPDKKGGPYNDYAGHVFWDMDTWIMPPIMLLHPGMGRLMIESRMRVMDTVKRHAALGGDDG
ncbi:unnamed protein product, partial [Owenia fusiformis]